MPDDDRKWLTEYVAPILLPEEEKLFLELTEPHQREIFKEEFWARRERTSLPAPLGPGYRQRYEELRRLADATYDGWRSDAGRMVLRYGEPGSLEKVAGCDRTFRDLEIWTYANLPGRGTMRQFFYRPTPLAPRKLWTVGTRDSDVFQPGSCRKSFQELANDCNPPPSDRCYGSSCTGACDVYRAYAEIRARQGSAMGGMSEAAQLLSPPPVSTEGMEKVRDRFAGLATRDAKPIGVEGPSGTTDTAPPAQTEASSPGATAAPGAPAPAAAPAPAGAPAAGGAPPAGQAPGKFTGPAPVRRKLSSKDVKELTAKLEPKYRDFLQLVELIITKDEREVFLQIADSYQKDRFIESFWRRRSIDSSGIRTDYQRVYTDRVQLAREQFRNLNNDRSKVFILNGSPDGIVPIDCQDVYVPLQIWFYERLESLKSKVYLIFYQPMGLGDYKLWTPIDGEFILQVGGSAGGLSGAGGRRVDVTRCTGGGGRCGRRSRTRPRRSAPGRWRWPAPRSSSSPRSSRRRAWTRSSP